MTRSKMRAQKQKCAIRRGHRFLKNYSDCGAKISAGALSLVGTGLIRLPSGALSAHYPWFLITRPISRMISPVTSSKITCADSLSRSNCR